MRLIKRCAKCAVFTFKEVHCGAATLSIHPPKYSFEDKYGAYRRKAKGMA